MALQCWASAELATELARCRECDGAANVHCVVSISWRYGSRLLLDCFGRRGSLMLRSTLQANRKCSRAIRTVQPTSACSALLVALTFYAACSTLTGSHRFFAILDPTPRSEVSSWTTCITS